MGKKRALIYLVLVILFSLNFISADFTLGNKSYNLNPVYGPNKPIEGWVNLSLKDEPAKSVLEAFNQNIVLLDFLKANEMVSGSDFICSPFDCELGTAYTTTDNGASTKSISLDITKEFSKLVGIKLTGNISSINGISSLKFDVSTNAKDYCLTPLKIDILDDKIIDWRATNVSKDFSCVIADVNGDYNPESWAGEKALISQDFDYCNTIRVNAFGVYKLDAEVLKRDTTGTESVEFELTFNAAEESQSCKVSTTDNATLSCIVETPGLQDSTDINAEVCVNVVSSSDNNKYEIKILDGNFPIAIHPGKYGIIKNFTLNDETRTEGTPELGTAISEWISDRYDNICNPCIIPIRFSGITQQINIKNMEIVYAKPLPTPENKFWDIAETEFFISSGFLQLDLAKANFLVPSTLGNATLNLQLDGKKVFEEKLEVKSIPEIFGISPKEVSALVEELFFVSMEGVDSNVTYSWNFGDGSKTETTDKKFARHTYNALGDYDITVTASNKYGTASKTTLIKVVSPKARINSTITEYIKGLNETEKELAKFEPWIKDKFNKLLNIATLKGDLKTFENQYDAGYINDEKAVEIMTGLLKLKIPYQIYTPLISSPSRFFPAEDQLDLDALDQLGAGKYEGSREGYTNAVNNWIKEKINISSETKVYYVKFKNYEDEPIVSYVKFILSPNEDLSEVYFVINNDPETLTLKEDITTKDIGATAVGIVFPELTEEKTLEFLIPKAVDFLNLPVYISPEFKDLPAIVEPGICNNNKICDKSEGETSKNCPNDCRSYGLTIWLWITLFIIALIVYIVLQEWYKRHYESRLFPNKNQLFNVINFINTSVNQGIKKGDIFGKLKDLDWNSEQLNYAWRKYNGERTGMWEIPVFKWIEKRQVRTELEKRTGVQQKPGR